ncbi:PDGLE domain-containing protein [Gordonia sp. ABSL49_1]|uniref:PDGLE domain-containing protein n=1 Tax=unclassified Gordonia (in: high G+C Gram-positive bacteria) TaxID=2657482 RepID=UPI001F0E2717|nr:PDGLE domain-containing protein [Gordonia sp. ABSL49_1]MCH5644328.1 PDGLE domain-containing protein [Gordonia sp. ABSL49_1]
MSVTNSQQTPSATGPKIRLRYFLIGFGAVALLVAGVISYFASSSPDGLDSATQRGCETVMVDGVEQLKGNCIAQHATDHAMASSPLADYSVKGIGDSNGLAGIIGVLVTLAVAGGLFWLIRLRSPGCNSPSLRSPGCNSPSLRSPGPRRTESGI